MAVYTEVNDDDLRTLLASTYGLGDLMSYKGIAEGVENTNYMVHTTTGTFILTLYERRVATSDLPFFLGLLEHLAKRSISCPLPVRTREGSLVSEIAGRTAAICTFLEGIWVRKPDVTHCAAVGRALAELHLAAADYALKRDNALSLPGWETLFARFADRADEIAPRLADVIAEELAHLKAAWPRDGLPRGIIHADLFPDNVFFLSGNLSGLIDFYFACNDTLAYDIAICLNAWCFEQDQSFNVTKSQALLRAYQDVRPLSQAELASLPTLARGAALRFLLTRSYDWLNTAKDALVKPHDPIVFLRRLRFHQSIRDARDYG